MFPFTVRQVEAFLALCDTGSFRETALRLGVSQPAVSRLLKSLEHQLGFALFDRPPGQRVSLLPAGEAFREQARAFMQAGHILGAARKPRLEKKLVSLRTYIGQHIMSEYLRYDLPLFYQAYPEVVLDFIADRPRRQVIEDIRAKKIDFAVFSMLGEIDIPVQLIGHDEAGICGADSFAAMPACPDTLSRKPFILPPAGTIEEDFILGALASGGVTPHNIVARAPFPEGRLALAAKGVGLIYSSASVRASFPQFRLTQIYAMPRWSRYFYLDPSLPAAMAKHLEQIVVTSLQRAERDASAA